MTVLTPEQILELFATGNEASIVGCYETDEVEFKGQYHLKDQQQKWELAKDVAAFANAGGGLIVVGVVTEPDLDRAEDQATALKAVPLEFFDPKQHREVIERWVYPRAQVDVVRHTRVDRCFGTILVTAQSSDEPFLVTRIPREDGGLVADTGIGWPVRRGAHTSWTPVGQIHEAVRRGWPSAASGEPTDQIPAPVVGVDLDAELDTLESYMGWAERAFLWLAATPVADQPAPLNGFYGRDGVEDAVARPFELRYAGFGLTYGRYENQEGRLVSSDGDGRYLQVEPNGTLIAAATAGTSFLTRAGGSDPTTPKPLAINPVVVTEWTYLFCRFVADVLAPRVTGGFTITIGIRGGRSRPWALRMRQGQWSGRPSGFFDDGSAPGMDDWRESLAASLVPERDAYELLARLYNLFGLSVDDLEIIRNAAVDADAIANIR